MRRPEPAHLLEGERGHRRGVVLGLTMAEMMLLLLFCLLLVSGALLQEQEKKIEAAEQRVDELVATGATSASPEEKKRVADDRKELEKLREEATKWSELLPADSKPTATGTVPDETWRELKVAQERPWSIVASRCPRRFRASIRSSMSNRPPPVATIGRR